MEIQTSKALSDVQQFRYELLQWCGNVEDAEKANTFVMGKDEKPVQERFPKSGMEDGIYLVHADGKATLFELEYTKDDNMDSEVVAIGLKMGRFGIKIAKSRPRLLYRQVRRCCSRHGRSEKHQPFS